MSTPLPQFHWIRKLVDEYEGQLVRYAARMTGDLSKARDVVQDTFLRLCGEEPGKIEPIAAQWLYRVCRNRVLDLQKKDQRMVATDFSKMNGEQPSRLSDDAQLDPAASAEQTDESRKAARLVSALPAEQQEVIRLKFEHAMSYREIAEITGLSVSNVGYLLHMGLKSLRQKMTSTAASESG